MHQELKVGRQYGFHFRAPLESVPTVLHPEYITCIHKPSAHFHCSNVITISKANHTPVGEYNHRGISSPTVE